LTSRPATHIVRYEPRFGPLLSDGRKQQTVRQRKPGVHVQLGDIFANAIEHSLTRLEPVGEVEIIRILPIQIDLKRMSIQLGKDRLTWSDDRERFARDDGFTCLADMAQWFKSKYPCLQVFDGFLYEWEF
jgi:hypothetical protein